MPITHAAHADPITATDYEADHVGGAYWVQDIDESGTSFSNLTAHTGTWSSNGTQIIQTDTSATPRRAKINDIIAFGFGIIAEVEVMFPTSGQGGGGNIQGGLLVGFNGTSQDSVAVKLDKATGKLEIDKESATNYRNWTVTVNLDTWYKIRVVITSELASVYLDGTLYGGVHLAYLTGLQPQADYAGLFTYGSSVQFRNIKVWTLSGGAPA